MLGQNPSASVTGTPENINEYVEIITTTKDAAVTVPVDNGNGTVTVEVIVRGPK